MTFLGKGLRPISRLLAVGAVSLPLAACSLDEILEVRDPAQVTPSDVDNAQSIPFLVNGAIRQFYGSYSGLGLEDDFVITNAAITDEMYAGDSFLTRIAADTRALQAPLSGNISDVSYGRFHQARTLASRAASNILRYTPDDHASYAMVKAIEGYTYVSLTEGWCGYLPFSAVPTEGPLDPTTIRPATPLTMIAALDSAIVRFDAAIAADPTAETTGGALARVGKARALLDKGGLANYTLAATTVAGLEGFSYAAEHSSNESTQNNPIYSLWSNGRYGVAEDEGGDQRADMSSAAAGWGTDEGEGMNFRSSFDPRVPWAFAGPAFSGTIRLYAPLEHPDYDADVFIVDPAEVQLIEAEAQLAAGDAAWLTTLNDLRAEVGLGALADPGTTSGRVLLLFRERAFWLYLTGHRQGDLRRLVRNYGFTSAQVWPTGTNQIRGVAYGADVAYPIPFNETNNPEFNPDLCSTTTN
jgi:starch-binding outer membrane protein, SusD/RagB family